ncbi:MAG: hypothetical protein WCF33_15880, partial [Pseudonocardiaceae bacterium]
PHPHQPFTTPKPKIEPRHGEHPRATNPTRATSSNRVDDGHQNLHLTNHTPSQRQTATDLH